MTATPADCNTGVQPRWGEAPDEPSPWFGAPKPELVGRRCCAAGHDGRAAETVSKLSFASSSPREERAGRGLRRGEFPIKTPLLSPALSSTSRRRGRRIDRRTSFETVSAARPSPGGAAPIDREPAAQPHLLYRLSLGIGIRPKIEGRNPTRYDGATARRGEFRGSNPKANTGIREIFSIHPT